MRILASFPGKHGDLLWALPTVRAISRTYGAPIDLVVSPACGSLKGLIEQQDYISQVIVDETWVVQDTAPITPRIPPPAAFLSDQLFHLGYEGWPSPDLARDIYRRARHTAADGEPSVDLADLQLDQPWIAPPYPLPATDLVVGFTDEHFELKYGLYFLLFDRCHGATAHPMVNISTSPRWKTEGGHPGFDWEGAASWIGASRLFVGCCSALHVLAVAMGKPVIVVEPNPHRHADVFYPMGKAGAVQLLLGNDGQPTVDARHLKDAIAASWARQVDHAVVEQAAVWEDA